jgi:hypothetical protein
MLCHSFDDFLDLKNEAIWFVDMASGLRVLQDDDRPGELPSAWERLIIHCQETGDHITNMWLRFRDHVEHVGKDKEGYYFIKSILCSPTMEAPNFYYIAGYLEDGIVKCKKWKVPELIVDKEFDRLPEDCGTTNLKHNILLER